LKSPSPSARAAALDWLWVGSALALGLALFWAAERRITGGVGWSSFPLDDSWIHLQFARNLAEGHGFSYNPGTAVAGSTAPAWTILLALTFAALGPNPAWAKPLGVAATLCAAFATRRLVRVWTDSWMLALVGGVTTALAGPMVWGALSGMEVALAALLVTTGLALHASHKDETAAIVLALAAVSRPECLLLLPLVWLAGPIAPRRTAIFALSIACVLSPWVLFNLATVGTPLPATASAKIEGGLIGFVSGTREPIATSLLWRPWHFEVEWARWLFSVNAALPVLVVVGLFALWRHRGRRDGLPASVLLLHPLGMALLAPYRGPSFQEGRYSIHLLPLAIAVALAGIGSLSALVAPIRRSGDRPARGWRALVGPALAAALVAGALWALPAAASRYAWAVENIDDMQVRMGRWVAANTSPRALIALNDIGAIAYVSRREVLDVMGLVTPAILPYRKAGEAGVLRYLEHTCPDYLIIFPTWFPALAAMSDVFRPIHRIRLAHNTVSGGDEMVVYETPWNRWKSPRGGCANERLR